MVAQLTISVDPATFVISVPQSDLTWISGDVYELDANDFRLDMKSWEASEMGIVFQKTHDHNTEVTLSGTTIARVIEILSPYTITFENLQYIVNIVGANTNISEKTNYNLVSIRSFNSAGLISGNILTEEVDYLKEGNISYEFVKATSEDMVRNVAIDSLDRVIIKYKATTDSDWSSPKLTQTVYCWYETLGDVNPIKVAEDG